MKLLLSFIALAVLLFGGRAAAAGFDVYDSRMEQWSSVFTSTGNQRQAAGRIPTTELGAQGYLATIVQGYGVPTTYSALHFFTGAAYFNGIYGPIESVRYSLWGRTTYAGHVWNLVLYQDGSVYESVQMEDSREAAEPGSANWRFTRPRSAPVSTFRKIFGTGPDTIQNGASAPGILVGVRNYNPVGLRDRNFALTTVGEFDFTIFQATITPVPEPCASGLIAGVVGLAGIARRRKR